MKDKNDRLLSAVAYAPIVTLLVFVLTAALVAFSVAYFNVCR